MRAFQPDHEHRGQPEKRPGQRRGENREDRQLDSEKCAHHGHQLDVAESHAFRAAPAQIDCSRAVDERRAHSRAQQGIEQGKKPHGNISAERQAHRSGQKLRSQIIDGNEQAEDQAQRKSGQGQFVGQQLGFGVGEDQAEQQERERAVFQVESVNPKYQ